MKKLKLTRHAVSYKMMLHHIELEHNSSWRQAFSRIVYSGTVVAIYST